MPKGFEGHLVFGVGQPRRRDVRAQRAGGGVRADPAKREVPRPHALDPAADDADWTNASYGFAL
eukprot:7320166-Alexandrium_andersonii.AAC.1